MINFYKIKKLLSAKEKKSLGFLFLYSIINSILEFLSIGMLIPIFTTLLNNDNHFINQILILLPFSDLTFYNTITILSLGFFITIFAKNIFSLFFVYTQSKFIYSLRTRISNDLFKMYLSQNYSFFFLKKSSEVLRNINSPINFMMIISNLITLMLDTVVILVLFIFLIIINPKITILLFFTFGVTIFLLYSLWKKRLYTMGNTKQNLQADLAKVISENILSIKEIILYAKENFFLSIFNKKVNEDAKLTFRLEIIQQAPKITLELLVSLMIFLLIVYLSMQNTAKEELIFILASFSIVALRLMPSISRISQNFQKVKIFSPSIDLLYQEFFSKTVLKKDFIESENKKLKFTNLMIDSVNYSYNGVKNVFQNNIDLLINKGDFIGIYGKSGSGKSTFVNLITGLLNSSTGNISLNGLDIKKDLRAWQNMIGYVPQNIYLLDDTISKNIAFGEEDSKINHDAVKLAAEKSQINEFIFTLSNKYSSSVGEQGILVSGGQKQRIGIARALYKDPEIIILDEATVALDKKIQSEIMELILKLKTKKTIIIISHDPEILKYCDKVFSIETNKVISKR